MKVFENIELYKSFLKKPENKNKTIGFVPTMGALHLGHISLIKTAKKQNDLVVASIFVNPKQFNDPTDFKNYPKTIPQDLQKLEGNGCDLVITPNEHEIYPNPEEIDIKTLSDLNIEHLAKTMEGRYRAGHFEGVINVVQRLFAITKPTTCYLGEKDFQQLSILKKMAQKLMPNITIIGCSTYREEDGLAMSSRNKLLTSKQRESAPLIYKTLTKANEIKNSVEIPELKNWIETEINKSPDLKIEYVAIIDNETLEPINKWNNNQMIRCCVACYAGKTRLIDNIPLIN